MRAVPTPGRQRLVAEQRLEEVLKQLAALHGERQAVTSELADFSEKSEERLGAAIERVIKAQRLVRRLEQLEAELGRVPDLLRSVPTASRGRARAASTSRARVETVAPTPPPRRADAVPETTWDLKELYRGLARRLHPDLATSDDDRTRRSALMAALNTAYFEEDRVRMELLATEIGSGTEIAEAPDAARTAHAERRVETLLPVVTRLEAELRRLRASPSYRAVEERRRREAAGADYFREELSATEKRGETLSARFRPGARVVEHSLRALNAAVGRRGDALVRSGVFRGAIVAPQVLTEDGLRFSETLARMARERPWKAAWVIAAFFGEIADRPPAGMASLDAWAERYEWMRPLLGRAPAFEEALADLSPYLELGCRVHAHGVQFGVQLRDPWHFAGVEEALASGACASLAAHVLCALGPKAPCARCGRSVHHVHVHRTRDPEPIHAHACVRCGTIRESYRAYGRPEGLEALAPYSLGLGITEELVVYFGGAPIRMGMLGHERKALTAAGLSERFASIVLAELSPELSERKLRVQHDGARLGASARVPHRGTITLSFVDRKKPTPEAVLASLRRKRAPRSR